MGVHIELNLCSVVIEEFAEPRGSVWLAVAIDHLPGPGPQCRKPGQRDGALPIILAWLNVLWNVIFQEI